LTTLWKMTLRLWLAALAASRPRNPAAPFASLRGERTSCSAAWHPKDAIHPTPESPPAVKPFLKGQTWGEQRAMVWTGIAQRGHGVGPNPPQASV